MVSWCQPRDGCRRMSDFPGTLRALMTERVISANELAGLVPCDPSLISRYRNGRQKPSAKMAARLDEMLGADGSLTACTEGTLPGRRAVLAGGLLAGGLLSIGPEALERLTWAERHRPQIDAAAVQSLADVLAAQRRAEDALGSAAMLRPALAQLAVVEDLVRQVYGPVRPALVQVAQQWAQFGWLYRDVGDVAGARACCAQALEWAAELGDRTMTATVLVERSYMAAEAGEVGSMIGLARAAQQDTRAAADQRALAAGLEARGYAMASDCAAAERKLGDAQDLVAVMDDEPGERARAVVLDDAGVLPERGRLHLRVPGGRRSVLARPRCRASGGPAEDEPDRIVGAGGQPHSPRLRARPGW